MTTLKYYLTYNSYGDTRIGMRFQSRIRYALRAMLDISEHESDGVPVSLKAVSKRTGISAKYLEQLVVGLKNFQLLRAARGRHGGYSLARPATTIHIGDIVEAAGGKVYLTDCIEDSRICIRSDICRCRKLWSLINVKMNDLLYHYTLSHLSDEQEMEKINAEIERHESQHSI